MSELFIRLQKILPQHALSRLAGHLARSQTPWLKDWLIRQFAAHYGVRLDEAQASNPQDYASFNDFFTRALKPGVRPLTTALNAIACPADGTISQLGTIDDDRLLQAKGHHYNLAALAGPLGQGFANGTFCTIYLAPRDYHRIHMPFEGELTQTLAIPGALFSVNGVTADGIEGLFARNERLVCRFDTDFGPMLVVLVGALIVASIETVWPGPVSPYTREVRTDYAQVYQRGDEIGRFLLGSTVICCFPPGRVTLRPELQAGAVVRMGEQLGTRT